MLKAGRILLFACLFLWTGVSGWAIANSESRCSRDAAGAISNARYYDPELGRFTQPDTDISDLSNPQSYNRYSYCRNDPLTYNDPTGHAPLLFDSEAWGQLLSPITHRAHNFFLGGSYPANNERAMLAQEGIQQWTPLTDANGNKLGNPATAVVKAGGSALLQAGTMMTPAGDEEAAGIVVKELKTTVEKLTADTANVGKPFTQAQKRAILDANRLKNGGELRSDLSGEALVPAQKSIKGVTPPANEAQVDHVIPRSKGGPNTPENAQVLTRQENRAKSDKLPNQ